jgi:hypothetical protein
MLFMDAINSLRLGSKIRRPHWEPGMHLSQKVWQGISVAVNSKGLVVNEMYNFPLNDVLSTDWEVLNEEPVFIDWSNV